MIFSAHTVRNTNINSCSWKYREKLDFNVATGIKKFDVINMALGDDQNKNKLIKTWNSLCRLQGNIILEQRFSICGPQNSIIWKLTEKQILRTHLKFTEIEDWG